MATKFPIFSVLSPFAFFSVVENFLVLEKAQNRVACPIGMNFDIKYDINVTNSFILALDFFLIASPA